MKWQLRGRAVELSWGTAPGDAHLAASAGCITSRVKGFTLPKGDDESALTDAIGVAHLAVFAPGKYEALRPQDTVLTGYELLVTARRDNERFGSTRVRLQPGRVPDLRLRSSAQLLAPGEEVTVQLLRGPDYTGELPEKLTLQKGYEQLEAPVASETREATFKIPASWQGWASVSYGGAATYVFVRPTTALTVKVTPEKSRYAPGQVAQLGIETTVGGRGSAAAVGLFGVDESLAQLTPLPGSDELAGLRPNATGESAFGALDAQALTLGRIRGANAAAATLARISAIPPAPAVEGVSSVTGSTVFDPNEALVDRFYLALGELSARVRTWEREAPTGEKLTPGTVAKLWSASLDALQSKQTPADDAWGRRLRLHRLPSDLLALTAPRELVVDGTRLPEDLENWSQWVAKEKP